MHRIGDKILHPLHGVGVIEGITEEEVLGQNRKYYIVNLSMKRMTVMVPVEQAEEIGVRKITKSHELEEMIEILKVKTISQMPTNWNRRYKFNLDKIKTGDIKEYAEVFRNLSLKEQKKGLSMGEKKMLENVKSLIVGEIACAKNMDLKKASAYIDEAVH